MRLSLQSNMGGALAGLTRLSAACRTMARGGERKDVLPPLVDTARELADEVFVLDAAPDGTPWTPVQKATGEALEETLAMRGSLYAERGPYSPGGFTIIVGYADEKARYHHFGTKRGGPISDAARRPFHPKVQRRGRWEHVRASAHMDAAGNFGASEAWHIPPRPLLPIGDMQAPRWQGELERVWQESFEAWLGKEAGF